MPTPIRFSSLFSGGGLVESGLSESLVPLWGVENDLPTAQVYAQNFPHSQVIKSDVCQVDFSSLAVPDWLHLSPPCQNFSALKTPGTGNSERDLALAIASCRAIAVLRPQWITIENVPRYQKSSCFALLRAELQHQGYSIRENMLNFADYGIPQRRKRLWVSAHLGDRPWELPPPQQHRGWGSVVQDLLGDLQPSYLTATQIKALGVKTRVYCNQQQECHSGGEAVLLKRHQIRNHLCTPVASEPSFTLTATLTSDGKGANRRKFLNLVDRRGVWDCGVRFLARIQTLSDGYTLSGNSGLDGKIIGNGIPPLFIQQLCQNNF